VNRCLADSRGWFSGLRIPRADGGYTGAAFVQWVKPVRPKLAVKAGQRSDARLFCG